METQVPDITRRLAEFAAGSRRADLPEAVWHDGRRAFVNYVGCVLGGCREPGATVSLKTLARFAGPAQATVVGFDRRLDALTAAFVNCTSSSVHSFNDTHFQTVAHPTSPVAAALLALAEIRPMSGATLIHALILGIELQCRVGQMLVTPPARVSDGLSMAGLVGCIGAAVAAGHAIGLDADRMTTAIGIAANQSAGLRQAHASMSSHFTAGNASRAGLLAALLAEDGFSCSEGMLEGPKGFAACFASNPNPEAALAGLGTHWEILANAHKPYPCGFVIHPVIDACLELARLHAPDPAAISDIHLTVNPLVLTLCDRPSPANQLQALVSTQHWAAVSLLHHAAGLRQGSEAQVHDAAVAALRTKVRMTASASTGRDAARAEITLTSGATLSANVLHCRGSEKRPMTDAELDLKFLDQAGTVLAPDSAEALRRASWGIDTAADAGAIMRQIWPG
jgi:2-methylcitrate dehydratase PrpD